MSVTFYPKIEGVSFLKQTKYVCDCVEFGFSEKEKNNNWSLGYEPISSIDNNLKNFLLKYRDPNCNRCGGIGLEVFDMTDPEISVNLANQNAKIILELMGFDSEDLFGSASLFKFQNALNKAKSKNISLFERKDKKEIGHREKEDGSYEIFTKMFSSGLSVSDIQNRLDRLQKTLNLAKDKVEKEKGTEFVPKIEINWD